MPVDSSRASARAARLELERVLSTDAAGLRAGLAADGLDTLERYVALLLDANRRLNLTRIVEPVAVAHLHLLDALAALPLADGPAPARALDLGSGGGVPGIVLAVARPSVAWTLLDAERRKADAMRGFVAALGLLNVAVVAERAEVVGRDPAHRGRYDLVTARACAALPVLVEYALPLLSDEGALVAWKARLEAAELRSGTAAAAELGGSELEVRPSGIPSLGERGFVVVRRAGPTPDRFPRRPGVASRRPLG